jgi:aerobic-type carbon monoxide dehydrogenase small subunit (CoxS/CutS family)
MRVRLTVNGEIHELDAPAGLTLLAALRDDLGLTGTRFGCGHGVCGACVVLVDGAPVPSCSVSAEESEGKRIRTVEGLADRGTLHPVQRAFVAEDAMQCGYCTSGMLMATVALLAGNPWPTDAQIRETLASHLCRCGVYGRALRAVKRAAS